MLSCGRDSSLKKRDVLLAIFFISLVTSVVLGIENHLGLSEKAAFIAFLILIMSVALSYQNEK